MPRRLALASIAAPSAMSESDRPRCQNRIGLVVAFAAGLQPGDDLAELGVQVLSDEPAAVDVRAQRAERAGLRHWPQSSTTILSMMSVSDSSTALIVP